MSHPSSRALWFLLLSAAIASLVYQFTGSRSVNGKTVDRPVNKSTHRTQTPTQTEILPDGSPDPDGAPSPGNEAFHANLKRTIESPSARPNEAILSFADEEAYRRFLARAQHRGLAVLGQLDALLTVRVRYDSFSALERDLWEYRADFSGIVANAVVSLPPRPARDARELAGEVPFHGETLNFLGVRGKHETWGRGIRIAVLDSGIAPDPTFEGGRVQYLNIGFGTLPGNGPTDGHGTSVASLAAGSATDAAGLAPGAAVMSIRVTDSNGVSDIFTVAQAILAAANSGVSIINLSMGSYATAPVLNNAISYAIERGAVIVAAAGNDQASQLTWPAADPRVISVGAVDARSQQVAFSNSGAQLQISAPGLGVQSAWLHGQRVYGDGTSASAPLVTGAIAAVMSQYPNLTAANAWAVVQKTTNDVGAPGADPNYGAGVLNLDWAMKYNHPTRQDPAVSSHSYDASTQQMNFVVQNRSAQTARNLSLDVSTNGTSIRRPIPPLAGGESYVVKLDLNGAGSANAPQQFTTQLVTPVGMEDANPANNLLSSRLVR